MSEDKSSMVELFRQKEKELNSLISGFEANSIDDIIWFTLFCRIFRLNYAVSFNINIINVYILHLILKWSTKP